MIQTQLLECFSTCICQLSNESHIPPFKFCDNVAKYSCIEIVLLEFGKKIDSGPFTNLVKELNDWPDYVRR